MVLKLTPDRKGLISVKERNIVQDNMDFIKHENILNPQEFKKIVNKEVDSRRKYLDQKQKVYIKARMEGRTKLQAATIARPDLTNPKSIDLYGSRTEKKPIIKRTFNSILVKAGITKELIASKLMDGLDAKSLQGQGKYSELLPDYNARHKYLTTAIELKGLKPKEELAHTYDPLTTKLLEMNIDQLKRIVGTSVIDGEVVEDIPDIKVLTITDKHDRG